MSKLNNNFVLFFVDNMNALYNKELWVFSFLLSTLVKGSNKVVVGKTLRKVIYLTTGVDTEALDSYLNIWTETGLLMSVGDNIYIVNPYIFTKGNTNVNKVRKEWSEGKFGILDKNEKPTSQEKANEFRKSFAWKLLRDARLDYDDHHCLVCNGTENLNVHHKTYKRFGGLEKLNDLRTICVDCHRVESERGDKITKKVL